MPSLDEVEVVDAVALPAEDVSVPERGHVKNRCQAVEVPLPEPFEERNGFEKHLRAEGVSVVVVVVIVGGVGGSGGRWR